MSMTIRINKGLRSNYDVIKMLRTRDDDDTCERSGDADERGRCHGFHKDVDNPCSRVLRTESVAAGSGHWTSQNQHHLGARHSAISQPRSTSPFRPTYSLCGSRLRWINIDDQLLGYLRSHSSRNALLLSTPHLSGIKHGHCGSTCDTYSNDTSGGEQHCQANNLCSKTSHILFTSSLVHFPLNANRRELTIAPQNEGRKFATDDINSRRALDESNFSSGNSGSDLKGRFISRWSMPVPESFRSMWSIDHVPSLHISSMPEKLKKLVGDKEIRRDDNFNIEEVTETEVPASRLHSGLKNGNGVHNHQEQLPDEALPHRSLPDNVHYTESVSVSRVPAHQEYRYGMNYEFDNPRRYRDEVRLVPGQTNPGRYYSSLTQCFINSKYRRYKETVFITLNAPNPKQYSTSVFVFPKSCRESFVSEVEHHDEKTIKWYKVGINMEAKDYVSVKFIQVN